MSKTTSIFRPRRLSSQGGSTGRTSCRASKEEKGSYASNDINQEKKKRNLPHICDLRLLLNIWGADGLGRLGLLIRIAALELDVPTVHLAAPLPRELGGVDVARDLK
jgi:hypothetical protein